MLSTICLFSWATSTVFMNGKGWVMAEKARVNKRQLDNSLGPMLLRLSRNTNNEYRNRMNKRNGTLFKTGKRALSGKENIKSLSETLTRSSSSLLPLKTNALSNRGRIDRSRLGEDNVLDMIPMDVKDIYVGSLNETFPIPLYLKVISFFCTKKKKSLRLDLKASTLVNSAFGLFGGGGLLAGGAALLGATGSKTRLCNAFQKTFSENTRQFLCARV